MCLRLSLPASPFSLYFFKEKSVFVVFLVLLSLVDVFCMRLPSLGGGSETILLKLKEFLVG